MRAMVADPNESSGCLILPLKRLRTLLGGLNLQLCKVCEMEVEKRGREGMGTLWASLPHLFGLRPRVTVRGSRGS